MAPSAEVGKRKALGSKLTILVLFRVRGAPQAAARLIFRGLIIIRGHGHEKRERRLVGNPYGVLLNLPLFSPILRAGDIKKKLRSALRA